MERHGCGNVPTFSLRPGAPRGTSRGLLPRIVIPLTISLALLASDVSPAIAGDRLPSKVSPPPSPAPSSASTKNQQAPSALAPVSSIVLPIGGWVRTTVVSKSAINTLDYGLSSPTSVAVCSNCQGGESDTLGQFAQGTELIFYLRDQCGTFLSNDSTHASISDLGNWQWQIGWDDGGAACGPDHDFNDLITTVSLSVSVPDGQALGCGPSVDAVDPSSCSSEPVDTASGEYFSSVTDLSLPGIGLPFEFARVYNSADAVDGPLGVGWTHSYNASLTVQASGDIVYRSGGGQLVVFALRADGSYSKPLGGRSGLEKLADGSYVLTRPDQVQYRFDSAGRLTQIADRNGNRLLFGHDGAGLLASITDTTGHVVTLSYDAAGRLVTVALPDGRSATYAYTAGRLTSAVDARGGTTTYAYDAGGRLASIVDPNGNTVIQNTYDVSGRVVQQVDGPGNITAISYDATNGITSVTDPRGGIWRYHYLGNVLLDQTDPLGNTTRYGYDSGLNRSSITDPRGNTWTMTYDARGNLTSRTAPAPLSYRESWTYNAFNDVTSYTDGRGNTTTYDYDPAGNRITMTQPGPTVTRYGRDPAGTGLLTSQTDPRGKTTTFDYDAAGNLVRITSPLGNVTTMTYDGSGRMVGLVDPRGNVAGANHADYGWTYSYDAADRLRSTTDPLGNRTSWTYDAVGNLVSRTDANGHTTSYSYDALNHLTRVAGPDNATTTYTYDSAGNLIRRIDATGQRTTYGYDNANRLSSVERCDISGCLGSWVWTYGHDPNGNLSGVTQPGGGTTAYGYDAANRLVGINYSDATPDVSYTYDADGHRTSMADGAGTEIYSYDAIGRLTQVSRGSNTFSYGYDAASDLTRRDMPGGISYSYAFDDDGQLSSVERLGTGGYSLSYGFDAAGNRTSAVFPDGYVESRTYDRAGRIIDVKTAKGATTLSRFAYTYDPVGNPTRVDLASGVQTYKYDAMDRLTEVCFQASCPGSKDPYIRYTYDAIGNRLTEARASGTVTYTYAMLDLLTRTSEGIYYTYDANRNVDFVGKMTGPAQRRFTYDLANRMTSATVGSSTTTYMYDGDGRRLSATTGTSTTTYLWDENWPTAELFGEYDGSGKRLRTYLYGDELVSMLGPDGVDYFYHPDREGSVANVTSRTGAVQWTYAYEPFGALRTETKNSRTAPENRMRFTSQYFDLDTSLYHLRARQYDQTIGRFYQPDPLAQSITDPYVATYVYVNNRPTVLVDPSGMGAEYRPIASPQPPPPVQSCRADPANVILGAIGGGGFLGGLAFAVVVVVSTLGGPELPIALVSGATAVGIVGGGVLAAKNAEECFPAEPPGYTP